ncbi:NACHT domain-containing protein [Parasphingorhabdus sp.]|uniref:NACHT domain-containing protein n=1 Tax=Parasphingorhabdus sp. TaxID=2709688 RepID=UPI0032EDF41F
MQSNDIDIPSSLRAPPDANRPNPPVETRVQCLPIGELSWENFERLCYRLVGQRNEVEHCARYGVQGEAQEGIDLFARLSSGRYDCWQAKRHKSFGATKLRDAVKLFLEGPWAEKTDEFTLAVQASLQSTAVQREIEKQTEQCKQKGIAFNAIDGEELSRRLRKYPLLVDDFFGRPWVKSFLGDDVARQLGPRLDGGEFAKAREQLASIYETQFHLFDPGGFGTISEADGTRPLSLLERFEVPDVMVREHQTVSSSEGSESAPNRAAADPLSLTGRTGVLPEAARAKFGEGYSRARRIGAADWVQRGERFVLLGEAGSGKSTMLRVIALEILAMSRSGNGLTPQWKDLLPIHIPFSSWVSQVERQGHAISLREMVRLNLQPFMTAQLDALIGRALDEKRILLLIDGLDEWGNEHSARTTLSGLITLVETHGLSAVVTGRPRGTDKIGAIPVGWTRGTIAPLSSSQQTSIASRWFSRHVVGSSTDTQETIAKLRTEQFSAEVRRDQNLSVIATVPLLLVGLITLALRGQILPRTRSEIYNELIKVLLELHPANRATAAGDTQSRFRHTDDPDQRRAAIARLAFHLRKETGGGNLSKTEARTILTGFLNDNDGYALSAADAAAAAREILAVNSETQGLIIEKAQDEFGFVHASFEEYLCAEYLGQLPFREIKKFVHASAKDSRWRNVIVHLLSGLSRRDEIEKLIDVVRTAEVGEDDYSLHHRERLLDEASVAVVSKAPQAARQLVEATMARIEKGDWMPARRSALTSLLSYHADATLSEVISPRIAQWLPATASYRPPLFDALGSWEASDELFEVLWRGLQDEDGAVQRSAAATFARCFGGSDPARTKIVEGLSKTRDLGNTSALLECLALGWKDDSSLKPLYEEAAAKQRGDLQLVGLLGLMQLGQQTAEMRDALLRATHFWSDVSYPYRDLAAALLMKYWNDDDDLIESALAHHRNRYDSPWEHDVATAFLLETPTDRIDVRRWIVEQLKDEFPFNTFREDRVWAQVGRFAEADPEIRKAANVFWCDPKRRLIKLHQVRHYVARIADPELATVLKAVLSEERGMNRYWALTALLDGWGREHPDVAEALADLAAQPDEKLIDVAAYIPALMMEQEQARERLLRMSAIPDLRRDMLANGLVAAGCDGSDEVAVSAILSNSSQRGRIFDPAPTLFSAFGANPRVRELAKRRMLEPDSPVTWIAQAFPNDPDFKEAAFSAAVPLPVELRTQCVEAASRSSHDTILFRQLANALHETDGELRVRMTIARCENANQAEYDALEREFLEAAIAVGPDHSEIRAAALAGLLTLDRLQRLATLSEGDKPVRLSTGDISESIPSVERLICSRLGRLEAVFGADLQERISSFDRHNFAKMLCAAPNASTAAKRAFLELAEKDELPKTSRAIRALAELKPGSDLLRASCFNVLSAGERNNRSVLVNAEVGLVLREQFADDSTVPSRLTQQKGFGVSVAATIPLAVYDPGHTELPNFPFGEAMQHQFGAWALGAVIAGKTANTEEFCRFTAAMVTRNWHREFDAQQFANRAIISRLREDDETVTAFESWISIDADPSVSGSAARYLVAAGLLKAESKEGINSLSDEARNGQQLPIAGFDPIAEEWRALRATLLDALAGAAEAR